MLVDFTVSNYRSIWEPVTLSAVAQMPARRNPRNGSKRKDRWNDDDVGVPYEVPGWDMRLVPVLGIFGANASGKSNVLRALNHMLMLSALPMPMFAETVAQFRLQTQAADTPTRFRVRFTGPDSLYDYGMGMLGGRIVEEDLGHSPKITRRRRVLFQRRWDADSQGYVWRNGGEFKGPHVELQRAIAADHLYMAVATFGLDVPVLKPIQAFFHRAADTAMTSGGWLTVTRGGHELMPDVRKFAAILSARGGTMADRISNLIRKCDTGIERICAKKRDASSQAGDVDVTAIHRVGLGAVEIPFEEESEGTQQLYAMAPALLDALDNGSVLVVDEISGSLHPSIVRMLLRMFHNRETNPTGAQLVFASHDYSLMSRSTMRRDEVWYTKKRPDGSTDLYPLTDFHVRNDLAVEKAYLDGRMDAVPILPPDEEIIPNLVPEPA